MLVLYWMTEKPLSIKPCVSISDALKLMDTKHIRRLPICENDILQGVVAKSDVQSHLAQQKDPNDTIASIMQKNVYTCKMNTAVETAGIFMRAKKVGGLPVIHEGKLVGIITESDVLGALAAIAHWDSQGHRFSLSIEHDKVDIAAKHIVSMTIVHNLQLLCFLSHALPNSTQHIITIRVKGDNIEAFTSSLDEAGYEILQAVELT